MVIKYPKPLGINVLGIVDFRLLKINLLVFQTIFEQVKE
jgi:hypothetical protein